MNTGSFLVTPPGRTMFRRIWNPSAVMGRSLSSIPE